MEIPHKLKEYIDNNRGSLPPITDRDEPLQIDSLGLIRMVAFLESELGYRVEDEELVAENFATLRKLGELLDQNTDWADSRSQDFPGGNSHVFGEVRNRKIESAAGGIMPQAETENGAA